MDHPVARAKAVTIGLFADPSLPNVLLGFWLSALLQWAFGSGSAPLAMAGLLAWLAAVVSYSIAEHARQAIADRKRSLLDDESDFYGIE